MYRSFRFLPGLAFLAGIGVSGITLFACTAASPTVDAETSSEETDASETNSSADSGDEESDSQISDASSDEDEDGSTSTEVSSDASDLSSGDDSSTSEEQSDDSQSDDSSSEQSDESSATSSDEGEEEMDGEDETIVAFDKTHVYFTADEDRRHVDVQVKFPPAHLRYTSIVAKFALSCPNGNKCDHWDRFGSVRLVRHAGMPDEEEIEIDRFVTAYRVGFSWESDLTDLRLLLTDEVTLRVFIDTWVGPGHEQGDGWIFDGTFEFVGGTPDRRVAAVLPVWGATSVEYGTKGMSIPEQLATAKVELPADAGPIAVRTFISGHGWGNADNCAEFCSREHAFTIDDTPYRREVWRDDCAQTGASGQQGTWTYSRAGWCPGAQVHPWTIDVSKRQRKNATLAVAYDVEAYENTCHPDAQPCQDCEPNFSCDDGHTLPIYYMSAVAIVYER
jgi:hypothetical protein